MKSIFPIMNDSAQRFAKYIEREQNADKSKGLDAKDLCSNYTTENIATCAFGLEGKCFDDPKSEFRQIGKALLTPSLSLAIKSTILILLPAFSKMLKVSSSSLSEFFPNC